MNLFGDTSFAVYAVTDWQFWAFALWFLIAGWFSIIAPGLVALHRTKLKTEIKALLAPTTGIALWGLQGFFFGFMNLRWLSYAYLIVFNLIFFKIFFKKSTRFIKIYRNISVILAKLLRELLPVGWVILVLGSVMQWLAIVSSGFKQTKGIVFYWINAFDGILHISFIRSLIESVPPIQPGAWPLEITNYHYWSDLIMADLARIWGLPGMHQYFQYFPIILAPLLALTTFHLVKHWTKSATAGIWAMFFYFFAGDMMYVFLLYWHGTLGEHTLTIDNGIIQFLNMPQAFAKLILLGGLFLFDQWRRKRDNFAGWLAMVLFATTVGFKVYFGMLAAFGLVMFGLVELIKAIFSKNKLEKIKNLFLDAGLKVLLMASLAASIFFPVNKSAGGIFWTPFEWPKLMLGFDKLNWNEWWLRLQVYQAANNLRALIVWFGLAIVIFLIASYGTRLIGLLFPRKIGRKIGWHNFWFLYPGVIFFSFIGMNFLQVSGLHNIFNFFVIALTVLSLITPVVMTALKLPKWLNLALAGLVIALTIPRVALTGWFYIYSHLKSYEEKIVSHSELEAFEYLAQNTTGLTQTHPKNLLDDYSPYTYIFTGKYNYFGGRGVLDSHNQPVEDRVEITKNKIFKNPDSLDVARTMRDIGVSHLIFQKKDTQQTPSFAYEKDRGIMYIAFENKEILILTYDKTSL